MPSIPPSLKRKITQYATVRVKHEAVEEEEKKLGEKERTLAEEINEEMFESGIKSINLDKLGRFDRTQRGPYCSIQKDEGFDELSETHRQRFEAWCKKNNLFDVFLKFMPVLPRVNSYVGAAIKEGKPLPDGLEMRFIKGVTWTRIKKATRSKARGK